VGGTGNDSLNGGAGADSLTGGAGTDTFVFAAGASGQATGFDIVNDYTKGARGMGDLIDYGVDLVRASSSVAATATKASVNQTTGVATFASGSGITLADGLADCAAATTAAGQFALFRVGGADNYYMFISDGKTGVTANDVVVQLVGVTSVESIDLTGGNLTIAS
jgi:Ca2+-binding RTX toxin-like protein